MNEGFELGVWYQIVASDPNFLSGTSVARFVESMSTEFDIRYGLATDLVGGIQELKEVEGVIVSLDDLLQRIRSADQIDWAFFFLFKEMHAIPARLSKRGIRAEILSAHVTIRLVDDTYFYVYTRDDRLSSYLLRRHHGAAERICSLENLEIPF